MRLVFPIVCLAGCLALSGCVAKAAWNVATLPVRAGSQVVDWSTTSRDEADRNEGRRIRRQREADAKAERKAEKQRRRAGYQTSY